MEPGSGSDSAVVLKTEEDGALVPKTETNSSLEQTPTTMSRSNMEPPEFISENKSYAEYKYDLQAWSRITALDKKGPCQISARLPQ